MPRRTTIGALVVTHHKGGTSTYRWVDKWTYGILTRDVRNAKEQIERAKRLLS